VPGESLGRIKIDISRDDLETWARRVEEIDSEMARLSAERVRLIKKTEAAEVLFDGEV